jgi:hypothetical protein
MRVSELKPKAPNDHRTIAPHLRGKVRVVQGRWSFYVLNTVTGQIVARDNGHRDLPHAFADAEFATVVARAAWMRGITQKSLARNKRKESA